MKKWITSLLVLSVLCLTACSPKPPLETATPNESQWETAHGAVLPEETRIALDGTSISVTGGEEDAVFLSHDIIYYEDRDIYESGNPYGEGTLSDRHSASEAGEHIVVNITRPGNYRISGTLSLGQIRVDLGEDAYGDPNAVVNLILDGASIRCTVAPAILFLNVYECDGDWSRETARAEVDTSAAGANLILEEGSENTVSGAYVAKIYKDKAGEKKLWKQDGAIYSYMSMNVSGSGSLTLFAENEGMDTELHLTIHGGNICIQSGNDGINTNEDGVSVTTINGGNLRILAGLGDEGDGIDSNGYLVINGGTVVAAANPAADAGLDSDLGSFINGGTVVALGASMDWAESDSGQVTMNLQYAQMQDGDSAIVVTQEDGTVVFAYDPGEDSVLEQENRKYMGAILSCAQFQREARYHLWANGDLIGIHAGGIYDAATVTDYEGGDQLIFSGTDVMMGPGMMGDFGGGQRPEGQFGDRKPGQYSQYGERPTIPEGETIPTWPEGEMPAMPEGQNPPQWPDGELQAPPQLPEGETFPKGEKPDGYGETGQHSAAGESNTIFYMQDMVNFFSGVAKAE